MPPLASAMRPGYHPALRSLSEDAMSTLHSRRFGPPLFGRRRQWIEWLLFAALAAAMWIMLPVGSAGAA